MFDRSLSNWWWQGNHRKRNVCEQKLFENNDNRTWLSLFYNRNDKLQGIIVWCKSYANANNARNEIFATSPRIFEAAIVWIRTNFPARNNSLEMLVSPEILRKFAPLENSREHFRGNTQLFKGSYLVTKHGISRNGSCLQGNCDHGNLGIPIFSIFSVLFESLFCNDQLANSP